jgi:hypothetical protein
MQIIDDLMHSYVNNIIFYIMLIFFSIFIVVGILLFELLLIIVFLNDLLELFLNHIFVELKVGLNDHGHHYRQLI